MDCHRFSTDVHLPKVLPLQATSAVALKLVATLASKQVIPLPEVIYLDSAHEEGETLLELSLASRWERFALDARPGMRWRWVACSSETTGCCGRTRTWAERWRELGSQLSEIDFEARPLRRRTATSYDLRPWSRSIWMTTGGPKCSAYGP